jgi:hypothetical protein
MPQLVLPGFPEGAIRIGPSLSVLHRAGRVTYFVGMDNYFSHAEGDGAGQQMALAMLVANGHVQAVDVESSPPGIAYRSLMRWQERLLAEGPGAFYAPKNVRSGTVLTPEKIAEWRRGRKRRRSPTRQKTSMRRGRPSPNGAARTRGWPKGWARLVRVPTNGWRRPSG